MAFITKVKFPGVETPYQVYDVEAYHGEVGNGTLTVQTNGTDKGTFKANATENKIINITAADLGLSAALKFKGSKSYADIILLTNAELGDVWLDSATGKEYVCVVAKTAGAGSWEVLGFDIDLTGYVTIDDYNDHTHDVEAASADSFYYNKTAKYLTASANKPAIQAKATDGTATVLTGVKFTATDNVLGEDTNFVVTDAPADTSKIVQTKVNSVKAITAKTASHATAGTPIARGNADVGAAATIPNVTGNVKVTIPNVTDNTEVAIPDGVSINAYGAGTTPFATFTANKNTDGADTYTLSLDSGTYGTGTATASLTTSGNVKASKVTLGTALEASKVTLGTAFNVTSAKAATGTITPYTFADVDCSEVTKEVITVATGALDATGTGATVAVNGIKSITVGASNNDIVAAATGVGANGTATVLKNVELAAAPAITLTSNDTSVAGSVEYVKTLTGKVVAVTGVTGEPKPQL